ncbi:MAG: T9SS type A sorting domain-containing protein, partial [Bacteroidota bacterium]|nr:T9SS type A sorting domain-containing protein [Bacteroidota bacterium]
IDTTIVILPVANGIPANPSLACDESGAFHLVWEENENIYYLRFLVVRTEAFETSHLLFDIRRFIHGFTEGCDLGVFDTVSVTWWASIRNAENDTVVASVELGKLMRDSTFAGIDSVRIGFPHQNVYSELSVETNIDVFPCVEWASRVGIPRNEHEYSTQKEAWSAQRDFERTLSLGPVSPNPFSSQAHIPYSVRAMGPVLLTIHDALGRRVATLVDGEQAEGTHSAIFDGSTLANGVYYCRLISGGRMITRRIHLIR